MEIDSSSKFKQRTEYSKRKSNDSNAAKRRNSSDRATGPRRQRLNYVVQEDSKEDKANYEKAAKEEVEEIESDNEFAPDDDSVHFLGNTPGCRSSCDGWLEEH